jgi:hypothetical protein
MPHLGILNAGRDKGQEIGRRFRNLRAELAQMRELGLVS